MGRLNASGAPGHDQIRLTLLSPPVLEVDRRSGNHVLNPHSAVMRDLSADFAGRAHMQPEREPSPGAQQTCMRPTGGACGRYGSEMRRGGAERTVRTYTRASQLWPWASSPSSRSTRRSMLRRGARSKASGRAANMGGLSLGSGSGTSDPAGPRRPLATEVHFDEHTELGYQHGNNVHAVAAVITKARIAGTQ